MQPEDPIQMVVGTYTDGHSKGIYSYVFDQESGKVKSLSSLEIQNPFYLTFSQNGKVLYAVSETNDENASVYAISYEKGTGKMKVINSMKTGGEDPCYVETDGKMEEIIALILEICTFIKF